MTSTTRDRCSTEQMKKIFATARERGISPDEVRAMTPAGSVKAMTWNEANAVINRLLGKDEFAPPPGGRGARRARRPADVFAPLTEDQRDTIDRRYRIAMGWTPPAMLAYLKNKTYPSDPSRTMDSILSSADGVAVTEHLKKVLYRTLAYHARKIGRDGPDPSGPAAIDAIKRMMTTLPPHPALSSLAQVRRAELGDALGLIVADRWLEDQRTSDGRLLQHTAFCHDAAELIYRIEAKLRAVRTATVSERSAPSQASSLNPSSDPPLYNIADYQRQRSAAHATD